MVSMIRLLHSVGLSFGGAPLRRCLWDHPTGGVDEHRIDTGCRSRILDGPDHGPPCVPETASPSTATASTTLRDGMPAWSGPAAAAKDKYGTHRGQH